MIHFNFNMSDVEFTREKNDLIIKGDNIKEKIDNFFNMLDEQIVTNESIIDVKDFIDSFFDNFETADGGYSYSSGVGLYLDESGDLFDGLVAAEHQPDPVRNDTQPLIKNSNVSLQIQSDINNAPSVNDVEITMLEDKSILITQDMLLKNSTDVDGDTLVALNLNPPSSGDGLLINNEDGTWTYTPTKDSDLDVTLTYEITDGDVLVDNVELNLEISAVADVPNLEVELSNPVTDTNIDLEITNYSGSAGYENTYGIVYLDDDGNPTHGEVIWANVKAHKNETFNMEDVNPDNMKFFLLSDGFTSSRKKGIDIEDGMEVKFKEIDDSGEFNIYIEDNQLYHAKNGGLYFSDGIKMTDNNHKGNQNWEDLNRGDNDYNDFNADVTWTKTSVGTLTYDLEIISSLTDTDGSENLTINIGSLPTGSYITNATENINGTWTLESNKDYQLVVREGTNDFNLTVTATSTESSNLDISTNTEIIGVNQIEFPDVADMQYADDLIQNIIDSPSDF